MTVVDPEPAERATSRPSAAGDSWGSRLRLHLAAVDGATVVAEEQQAGRLGLEVADLPANGPVLQASVAYPPSGIASGERFSLRVDVTDRGQALLRTVRPMRFGRSAGPASVVERQLTVSSSARLEWLPRETVVGEHAYAQLTTRVILEEDARFIGWEIVSLGPPRNGASDHDGGRLVQRLEVRRAGQALVDERLVVERATIRTSTGAAGGTAFGTLVAVAPQTIDDAVADRLLRDLTRSPLPGSVWQVGGALMVRIPATAAEQAVSDLIDVWRRLRPLTIGRAATDLPAAMG